MLLLADVGAQLVVVVVVVREAFLLLIGLSRVLRLRFFTGRQPRDVGLYFLL